jgi:hypothetical protein
VEKIHRRSFFRARATLKRSVVIFRGFRRRLRIMQFPGVHLPSVDWETINSR